MKQRVLCYLTILVVLVGLLVSCGPAPTVEEPTAPPSAETEAPSEETEAPQVELTPLEQWAAGIRAEYEGTTLRLAVASHPSIEAFRQMTPDFEALTGITVIWDEMEEGVLADKLLIEASAGRSSYDVIMNCPEFTPALVELGVIEPLDRYIQDESTSPEWFDYEDILAAYRDMLSYEGQHYGIPFAGETVFLFYRQDLFDEYDVAVPQTFEELLQTAAFFQGKEEGLSGISMRTRLGWECTYMWSVFIFPFGGYIIDPDSGAAGLNDPGTVASLEYMIDLLEYAPVGVESFSFPEAWDAFMQGKTAMMVEASAAAPEVENPDKSVVAGNVGYAPMPAGPAGAYSGVWGWGLSITASSENQDAAWALITYLTSKELQDEYIANGGIVSRSSALSDPARQAQYPYYQAILDTLEQAAELQEQGLGVVVMIPEWSQISEIMGAEAARAIAGEISAQAAADNMQVQVEAILPQ